MSYLQPERKHLADTDFVLSIMGEDEFVKFTLVQNDDKCLEQPETAFRLNDEQLSELLYKVTKCRNTAEFQALDVTFRDKYLRQLRSEGLPIREVSRVTGVSIGIVRSFNMSCHACSRRL